jgi:7-cyano-7-deazaguanine synthase
MRKSSVVLLSAGLDSTVNFYAAMQETAVKLALTFDYGQRAAAKEIAAAKELAALNQVRHTVVELPWYKELGVSALTNESKQIPTGRKVGIDSEILSVNSAKAVWAPNRNGLFLNIAASYAESLKADLIVPGFNREEAATFPDNSLDFIRSVRKSLVFSTATAVDIQCYTIAMTKLDIVELGCKLRVPFEKTWPCYFAKQLWCGECESCQRAKRAYKLAKVDIHGMFEK